MDDIINGLPYILRKKTEQIKQDKDMLINYTHKRDDVKQSNKYYYSVMIVSMILLLFNFIPNTKNIAELFLKHNIASELNFRFWVITIVSMILFINSYVCKKKISQEVREIESKINQKEEEIKKIRID